MAVNGMLGGLSMLATTLAPVLTGLLIQADIAGLSWRPIFLINVPFCVAALSLAARHLPAGTSARRLRVDGFGTTLVIAATGLLVFPLIEGRVLGWPGRAYAMIGASALLFAVFASSQRHAERAGKSPLVIPALFRHRSFSLGLVISVLLFAAVACFALTATVGLIVDQPGPGASTWQLAPALVILGAGLGMVVVPLLPFILSSIDPADAGSASGVASAVQQIGGALGLALIGSVFFGQLGTTASYGHAFMAGIWLQVALLGIAAAAAIFLPARIGADAYQPHL